MEKCGAIDIGLNPVPVKRDTTHKILLLEKEACFSDSFFPMKICFIGWGGACRQLCHMAQRLAERREWEKTTFSTRFHCFP